MTLSHKLSVAAVATLVAGLPCGPALAAAAIPGYVAAAVKDDNRPVWDIYRDAARKPAEVIAFSRAKPGDTIVDLVPGDAYYTRIFSPLAGSKGRVYAIVPNGGGAGDRGSRENQREGKLPAYIPGDEAQSCVVGCYPGGYPVYVLPIDLVLSLMNIDHYANITALWEELSSYGGTISVPYQADVIFTSAYHELHYRNMIPLYEGVPGRVNNAKPLNVVAFTKSVFGALNSGGYYIVSDYQASTGHGFADADSLHRTEAVATKAEILAAGFVLDGESNILANAADDHTKPVTGKADQRDQNDQYLLRFKKPDNAPDTSKRPKNGEDPIKGWYGNTIVHGLSGDQPVTVKDGMVIAGVIKGITPTGDRLRYSYYNSDHTYEEFGRVGEGPGPMQAGTWYWDAEGHNCQIHQFPANERQNIVCHVDAFAHKVGAVESDNPDGTGRKTELVPGHVHLAPGT